MCVLAQLAVIRLIMKASFISLLEPGPAKMELDPEADTAEQVHGSKPGISPVKSGKTPQQRQDKGLQTSQAG